MDRGVVNKVRKPRRARRGLNLGRANAGRRSDRGRRRAREDRGWVVENGFFILNFGGFSVVIAHPGGPVGSGPIDGGSVGGNLGEAHPSRCRQVGG